MEDFYQVIEEDKVPQFDVLITNPPYSGEHPKRIIEFAVEWYSTLINFSSFPFEDLIT